MSFSEISSGNDFKQTRDYLQALDLAITQDFDLSSLGGMSWALNVSINVYVFFLISVPCSFHFCSNLCSRCALTWSLYQVLAVLESISNQLAPIPSHRFVQDTTPTGTIVTNDPSM